MPLLLCVDALFSAVRDTFREPWNDSSTKILSVTSINGFIIAFNRQLKKNGIKGHDYYTECFSKIKIDFSKEQFLYASSQYRKFSNQILKEGFGFSEEELAIF